MDILGIDPSPDGKHCCVIKAGCGRHVVWTYPMFEDHAWNVQVIVLELPCPQGIRSQNKNYTRLCIEYGKLLHNLQQLYPDARIFEVPANVIRQQAGWNSRSGIRADKYITDYLQRLGYKTGKGTLFKSTHSRDALMCALFNWSDVHNSIYEVK